MKNIQEIEKNRLAHGWASLAWIHLGVGFIALILVICFMDHQGPHRRGSQAAILASMALAGACIHQADRSQRLSRGL